VPAPTAVVGAKSPAGADRLRPAPLQARIADPAPTWVVHSTFARARRYGSRPDDAETGGAAGLVTRSGASEGLRDHWWVGWSATLVLGAWLGFDEDRPMPAQAAGLAAALGEAVARRGLDGLPPEQVVAPEGVVTVEIDETTGLRAAAGCSSRVPMDFVSGTAPAAVCRPGARMPAPGGGIRVPAAP
jgi:hypothetical protein